MSFWNDLRFSLRQLRKSLGFTITVLAILGLCIGANTAIYSVVDAVLVQSLPYPQADRLGGLARHTRSPKGEDLEFSMDGAMWEAVHHNATKVESAAEGGVSGVNLAAGSRIEYVQEQRVSAGYFHVLGTPPQAGREFAEIEDRVGGPAVTVLSYGLWERVFHRDLAIVERIRALPGVESAAVGLTLPYQRPLNDGVRIVDGPKKSAEYSITEMIFATPGYFETLRLTLRSGRTFAGRDSATGQPVAIINQAFARKYLDRHSPLGTHLGVGDKPAEIVGLVADTPQHSGAGNFGPLSATPTVYVPFAQTGDAGLSTIYTWFSPNWVVRTRGGDTRNLIHEMQTAIQAIDPRLPFSTFKSMEDLQDSAVAGQRYEAALFSIFAALALVLAAVGCMG